jgi:hypothetical protein
MMSQHWVQAAPVKEGWRTAKDQGTWLDKGLRTPARLSERNAIDRAAT